MRGCECMSRLHSSVVDYTCLYIAILVLVRVRVRVRARIRILNKEVQYNNIIIRSAIVWRSRGLRV